VDDTDTDRGEHLVESCGELGVPFADEESESPAHILQVRGTIAGYLCDPWAVRVNGGSEDVHDPALYVEDDRHEVAPKEGRLDVDVDDPIQSSIWLSKTWRNRHL
jgi:hypothetical protein